MTPSQIMTAAKNACPALAMRIPRPSAVLEFMRTWLSTPIEEQAIYRAVIDRCAALRSRGTMLPGRSDVFGVREGQISSLDIYFDSAPFPK
jgi:hypothetical protein